MTTQHGGSRADGPLFSNEPYGRLLRDIMGPTDYDAALQRLSVLLNRLEDSGQEVLNGIEAIRATIREAGR
jgi:hypothetical protein